MFNLFNKKEPEIIDKGLEMIENFLEKIKTDKMARKIVHYYIQNKDDGDLY